MTTKRRIVQRKVVHRERAREQAGYWIRYTLECGHVVVRRGRFRDRCVCPQCGKKES